MHTSRRSTLLFVLCALLWAGTGHAQVRQVATVDAVRLRADSSTNAAPVRTLGIATPVTVEGTPAGTWLRVRTADGARGWVRRDLTVPWDAASPLAALRTIAARSMAAEGAPFEVRARLVNVLSDAARSATAPAAKAELSLLRLQALQKALDAHAARRNTPSGWEGTPLRDGNIRADTSEIAYGEPQGQWYVRADLFWALHDRFRTLPIAERIAWAAATQDLGGECELDPTCMFGFAEITSARYLSLYPRGAHAATALRDIGEVLDAVEEETRPREKHTEFCTRAESEYALKPEQIAALSRIVAASSGAEKARVAALLRTLAARCV